MRSLAFLFTLMMAFASHAEKSIYFQGQSSSASGFVIGDEKGPSDCVVRSSFDPVKDELVVQVFSAEVRALNFAFAIAKPAKQLPLKEGKIVISGGKSQAFYNSKNELHLVTKLSDNTKTRISMKVTRDLIPAGDAVAVELYQTPLFEEHINKELRCNFRIEEITVNSQF